MKRERERFGRERGKWRAHLGQRSQLPDHVVDGERQRQGGQAADSHQSHHAQRQALSWAEYKKKGLKRGSIGVGVKGPHETGKKQVWPKLLYLESAIKKSKIYPI